MSRELTMEMLEGVPEGELPVFLQQFYFDSCDESKAIAAG